MQAPQSDATAEMDCVLHNIANILNSVNTSITIVSEKIQHSKISNLSKVAELLETHKDNLMSYLTDDLQGKELLTYIPMLAQIWEKEKAALCEELTSLEKNMAHVKAIISKQQSSSMAIGVRQEVSIQELIEEALALNKAACIESQINIKTTFAPLHPIITDRVVLLQILVNLIKNSVESLRLSKHKIKQLSIHVKEKDSLFFAIEISDNGLGVSKKDAQHIFSFGFTTKKEGHGFGLYYSALNAKNMGGNLTLTSEGVNKGALFTLILPYQKDS